MSRFSDAASAAPQATKRGLRYYIAHGAGFLALAKFGVDVIDKNYGDAVGDLATAGAAFGLNLALFRPSAPPAS